MQTPKELSILAMTVREMDTLLAQARVQKVRHSLGVLDPAESGPRSASELAATLTPQELAQLMNSNTELQKQIQVRISDGPRATLAQLIEAKKRGQAEQVLELLNQRELATRLQQQKRSLP